jgi:transcriptional regulator with XRE-family HTH domain
MFFANNIKLLRTRRKRTQDELATGLNLKRPTLSGYENGIAEPGINILKAFSDYYGISIDTLIKVDLNSLSESQLSELERGYDIYIKGSQLRVLTKSLDTNNKENIELVPIKAKAGYTAGFNDPEFITSLPSFQLPFLSSEKSYRAFQIEGDSMLPIPNKSYVIAEYIQDWREIKDGLAYIIVTEKEGIVFKVAYNEIKKRQHLLLKSLNPLFEPYTVNIEEVKEVWKFVNYFTDQIPSEFEAQEFNLKTTMMQMQNQIYNIQNQIQAMGGKENRL